MKQILLIAWREYKQYVLSRGFLLFLVMFPVGLTLISGAMGLVERSKPVRTFVVLDASGRYVEAIDREVEQRHLTSSISAWDMYLLMNATPEALKDELIPYPFGPGASSNARTADFMEKGGFSAAMQAVQPHLKSGAPDFTPPKQAFLRLPLPEEVTASMDVAEAEEKLRPYLLNEKQITTAESEKASLFAAVLIPGEYGADGVKAAQYWSRNLTDNSLQSLVSDALRSALQRAEVAELGVNKEQFDDLASISASLNSYRPDRTAEDAQLSVRDRIETAMPAVLTYMLLVIIFGVGNLLLTNTIEERSNKIIEVLLSSVTANQLMMGKLLGIGAVGLTMPTIFLLGGGVASVTVAAGHNVSGPVMSLLFSSPLLLIYFFYFFCAYVIFAMIFLAIGAISNSLQDAQSYMGPVMLVIFAPMPFIVMVFQNPNGLVASILTWIPIYTPYAVMMRIAADPPLWEIVGATLLMLVFAVILVRVMGRIFRNAILQASPPKASEVWRLARGDIS